jgi:hypothetical protein
MVHHGMPHSHDPENTIVNAPNGEMSVTSSETREEHLIAECHHPSVNDDRQVLAVEDNHTTRASSYLQCRVVERQLQRRLVVTLPLSGLMEAARRMRREGANLWVSLIAVGRKNEDVSSPTLLQLSQVQQSHLATVRLIRGRGDGRAKLPVSMARIRRRRSRMKMWR